MKRKTRKLMSAVVALAMICSMIPAALAAFWPTYNNGYDYSNGIQQNVGIPVMGGSATLSTNFPQYATYNGWPVVYAGYVNWSDGTGNFTVTGAGSNATVTNTGSNGYYGESTQVTASALYYPADQNGNIISTVPVYINQTYNVTVGGTTTAPSVGGSYTPGYPSYPSYPSYPGYSGYDYLAAMSQSALALNVGGSSYLYVSPSTAYFTPISYSWSSSDYTVASVTGSTAGATVTGLKAGQATVTAQIYGQSTADGSYLTAVASCVVTVSGTANSGDLYISSSTLELQPNSVGSYSNYGTLSVTSTSYSSLLTSPYLTWTSSNPSVAQVAASNVGSTVYIYAGVSGQSTITATLTNTNGQTVGVASCLVTVGSSSAGDIAISLTAGQSKTMSASDFSAFWSKVTGGLGTFSHVSFSPAAASTVGKLVYTPSTTSTAQSPVTSGVYFYANPTSTTYRNLNTVSFVPTAYGTTYYTGTLTVPFVAYGTTSATSSALTARNGTLTITVTHGNVGVINYNLGGSASVNLDPAHFVSVYKTAVSNTLANPNIYIQFQSVPTFGALYYNYNNYGYSYGAAGTKLTAANIGTMYFSSLSNYAYGIDDLTYIPSSSGAADTVRYTAYAAAGGTPLYTGEIKFSSTGAASHVIKFHTTPGTTVTLDLAAFQAVDALDNYPYIALGSPSGGKLYTEYKNGTGAAVTKNTTFALGSKGVGNNMKSITAVTVVPTTSSGTVKIPFTASTYTGSQLTGTIEVYVAKKFPDVSSTNWATKYITELVAKGVVSGDDKGNFNPKANLKYGEALKMIMEATGYSKQVKTGSHWASGYLTKAYADGLVSSKTIDLEKTITRDEIAEITAKALGLKAVYTADPGISNPVDSSNGYVQALYNAGILAGSFEGGKNYYYGSQPIIREQISKIICLAADYYEGNGRSGSASSSITPGTTVTGTTTTVTGTTTAVGNVYTHEHETTYHRTSTCMGRSYPTLVSVAQAEAGGRSACLVCFPK